MTGSKKLDEKRMYEIAEQIWSSWKEEKAAELRENPTAAWKAWKGFAGGLFEKSPDDGRLFYSGRSFSDRAAPVDVGAPLDFRADFESDTDCHSMIYALLYTGAQKIALKK